MAFAHSVGKNLIDIQSSDERYERYELWIGDLDFDFDGTLDGTWTKEIRRLENLLNQAISKYSSRAIIVQVTDNFRNLRKHVFVRVNSELAFLELLKPETQLKFDGAILNIKKSKRIPSPTISKCDIETPKDGGSNESNTDWAHVLLKKDLKEIKDEFQVMLDSTKANHEKLKEKSEKLKEKSDTLNQLVNSTKGNIDKLNELGARFEKTEADIKDIENMTKTATSKAVEGLGTI